MIQALACPIPLPWQLTPWKDLIKRHQQGRIPHALMFAGVAGLGQELFAHELTQVLLCEHPIQGEKCASCRSCQWMAAHTHPDYLLIEPEEIDKPIRIDQIRSLIEFHYKTASTGKYKIICIQPAHAMNIYAANALLKTLEEPAPHTLIQLITDQPMLLPATIRSRCQVIDFITPDIETALHWLHQAYDSPVETAKLRSLFSIFQGAPFKVLEALQMDEIAFRDQILAQWEQFLQLPETFTELAGKWCKLDPLRLLRHWISWIEDLIILQQTGHVEHLQNRDYEALFLEHRLTFPNQQLYKVLKESYELHDAFQHKIHLNIQMVWERLLILLTKKDE